MPNSQDITHSSGENAIFMVFNFKNYEDNTINKVKNMCLNAGAISDSMRNRFSEQGFSCVTGFGADAWGRLFPEQARPKELNVFREIKGQKHTAVSTPGDLFFHIRAKRQDLCFEAARLLGEMLEGVVEAVDEVHGFRYLDGRAIIGFVDGTANPVGDERLEFAAIGDEDPNFAGGSYAFVQKYLHDMQAWGALPLAEQEKAIGRRRYDDLEMSDAEKPANAHNAVTNITDETGREIKIVRANMPFAKPGKGEYGTYLLAMPVVLKLPVKCLRTCLSVSRKAIQTAC